MALVRRGRFFLTNHVTRPSSIDWCAVELSTSWSYGNVIQEVAGAICWRCKNEFRDGDHLVHVECDSLDEVAPKVIYHYRCIPPAMWKRLAGSLPAWELPSDESPGDRHVIGGSSD